MSVVHEDLRGVQQVDRNRNGISTSDVEKLLAVVFLICTALCYLNVSGFFLGFQS